MVGRGDPADGLTVPAAGPAAQIDAPAARDTTECFSAIPSRLPRGRQ